MVRLPEGGDTQNWRGPTAREFPRAKPRMDTVSYRSGQLIVGGMALGGACAVRGLRHSFRKLTRRKRWAQTNLAMR